MIVQLTPGLPPSFCGVGAYALAMGESLATTVPGSERVYVAMGYDRRDDIATSEGRLNATGTQSPEVFWQSIRELVSGCSGVATVILHYSGYGYSRNGAPTWLATALENKPSDLRDVRIITFFHELFAYGRPWQKAFWNSYLQRRVAIRIARSSDAMMSNREKSARWLEKIADRTVGSVVHVPICSTMGEPDNTDWGARPKQAVVFGAAAYKKFALLDDTKRIAKLLGNLGISQLVDIGQSCRVDTEAFGRQGIAVIQTGNLPSAEISKHFLNSRVGLLDYNPHYLDKSSVFASFQSHGVACIMPSSNAARTKLSNYLSLNETEITENSLKQNAEESLEIYKHRSSAVHASAIGSLICRFSESNIAG